MESTAVTRITVRKNHIGVYTATLVLASQARIHAFGATKSDALNAAQRKYAAYLAPRGRQMESTTTVSAEPTVHV